MITLLGHAVKLRKSGHFSYNAGKNDILNDIFNPSKFAKPTKDHEYLLRQVIQQPTAIFCGTEIANEDVLNEQACCCFAHIVLVLVLVQMEL